MSDAGPGEAGTPSAPWSAEARRQQAEARSEAFGYVCNRCSHCCRNKQIQVNPYEIARLARRRGVSTSAFVAQWTQEGAGSHLARQVNGACVFLGPQGCEVHADRPLVCRIYPLGRHVESDGTERWSHVTPQPRTAGVYSKSGTIADYLAAQGAGPFMQAADEYAIWLRRAAEMLDNEGPATDAAAEVEDLDLLDIDSVIAAHAAESGEAAPMDIEARKALHLAILAGKLEESQGGA
jgi:Fe-S-cluster containining protein